MQDKLMSHDKMYLSYNKNVASSGVSTRCRTLFNAWNISTLHVACDKVGPIRV